MRKFLVATGIFLLSLVSAGRALAQTDNTSSVLQPVVVTAERRTQHTVDIPGTIQAISGAALTDRGINSIYDLSQVSAGVTMERTSVFLQPSIRGISSRVTAPGDENNTAIYVDGVYQSSFFGLYRDFVDIDRIEILKGPQGTLYGRNATAGAINIITVQPSVGQSFGQATITGGNYGYSKETFSGNLPLSNDVAALISGFHERSNGYYSNLLRGGYTYLSSGVGSVGGYENEGVRGRILYERGDFSLLLTGSWAQSIDSGAMTTSPVDGDTVARKVDPTIQLAGPYQWIGTVYPVAKTVNPQGSAIATVDMRDFKFVSTTAYEFTRTSYFANQDDSTLNLFDSYSPNENDTSWQQEFRLVSKTAGPLSWVVGAFGFRDGAGYLPLNTNSNGVRVLDLISHNTITSYAGFGQATYELARRFRITAGLRYTWESRRYRGTNELAPALPSSNVDSHTSNSRVTPKISAEYLFTPLTHAYVTVASGFKSAIFNTQSISGTPVKPETVTSYEAGLKHRSGWVDFAADAFYMDYRDLQVSGRGATGNSAILQNAPKAEIEGGEVEATMIPTENLSFSLNLAYLHAKYVTFNGAAVEIPTVKSDGIPVGGNTNEFMNVSGEDMVKTPHFSGNLAVSYKVPTGFGHVLLNANASYVGKFYFDTANIFAQSGYEIVNASATMDFEERGWKVWLWINNISGQRYATYENANATSTVAAYNEPRNFGVTIGKEF